MTTNIATVGILQRESSLRIGVLGKGKSMSPWDVLQNLYDSGISAGIQSMWDSGLTAWVGDERSGVKAERIFRRSEFDCIAAWLDEEGRRHFPNSRYSRESYGIAMNDAPDYHPVAVGILTEMRESSRKPPKRAKQSRPARSTKDQRPKWS